MASKNVFKAAAGLFNKGRQTSEPPASEGETSIGDRLQFWKSNAIVEAIGKKTQSMQDSAENFKLGMALLIGAGCLFALSTLYLPLVVLFPQKFCALFSLGSMTAMLSISVMVGHERFLKKLVTRELVFYSITYVVSLMIGIYYSCIVKSYILAILAIIAQGVSLAYLVFTNLPYGKSSLNMVFKTIYHGVKSCIMGCLKTTEKPYLPL